MRLKPGDSIGEYRILEAIGNGGFSVIYRAEDTNLLRPVAIKQLSPEIFSEEGSREWFIREARLSASLNHPNIVSTYALREQGDSLFLVMEYLPGGDLHTLIEESGPLDRSTLLKVASNMCDALRTLHSRGVIHRDIKPENILIADEGQFKLADFGLAHIRQAHHHSRLNATSGPQPGTLLYMSPEQALGQEVTVQSDIYSLGVVLYEAMTGHYYLSFDQDHDDEETLLKLIETEPPFPPTTRHPTVPDELADPLLHALNKDPGERPPSAREFLAEIKNAISRSKRATMSQKRRPLVPSHAPLTSPELLSALYAVRTLRDADHKPREALAKLRDIWEKHSGIPEVAAEWGETLVALGRIEEGRGYLERAVRIKPGLPFAQLALADLYRDDDSDDEADNAIIEAIHADPDLAYAVLYEDIVNALDDPDTYKTYITLFQRALEEKPTPSTYHNLGQVLALAKGHEQLSIRAFETAIDRDPDYGPAYVGLGSLLIEMGQLTDAIRLLEQATYRVFPVLPPGDWHKANTVYQRPHAFLALAVAYAEIEQYENSAIAANTVLDLAPEELEEDAEQLLEAYTGAAQRWIADGDDLRAYKLLNQLIPLAAQWGNVEIFTLLGVTQSRIGIQFRRKQQWNDAIDWLKAGLLNLQRVQPHSREAQKLAEQTEQELKKAERRRLT